MKISQRFGVRPLPTHSVLAELLFNLTVGNRLDNHGDPGWIHLEETLFGRQSQLANLTY